MEPQLDRIEKNLGELTTAVTGLTGVVTGLVKTVNEHTVGIESLTKKVDSNTRSIDDLTEIVVSMKGYMETELVTKEELGGKMQGLQRAIDGNYERQSALESRILKVETKLRV